MPNESKLVAWRNKVDNKVHAPPLMLPLFLILPALHAIDTAQMLVTCLLGIACKDRNMRPINKETHKSIPRHK